MNWRAKREVCLCVCVCEREKENDEVNVVQVDAGSGLLHGDHLIACVVTLQKDIYNKIKGSGWGRAKKHQEDVSDVILYSIKNVCVGENICKAKCLINNLWKILVNK